MIIPNIIATQFYEQFEKELYDFTFMYKTDSYLNKQSIMSLCEAAVCASYNITREDYIDDVTDIEYDEIFGQAAIMTEHVINIMLTRFMEQHNGT